MACSVLATATGSALTVNVGIWTYSVTTTQIPSAISLAIAFWFVICNSQQPHRSLRMPSLCWGDYQPWCCVSETRQGWGVPGSSPVSGYATTATHGPKQRSLFPSWCTHLSGFTVLFVFRSHHMSPQLPYIIFLCLACFQTVVLCTVAVFIARA